MNPERDFEHEIISVFLEMAPSRPPDHLLPSAVSSARRKRRWPRWYALIKEPPMRISSSIAVGSPAARVAAILVATVLLSLLVAGTGFAGARILAAGPIVVAQDGSGTYTTISEAVAAADDGETVQVRPGTYHESLVISKDIILTGDGERESVIIEVGDDSPVHDDFFYGPTTYGILLDDSDAEVRDLTIHLLPSDDDSIRTAFAVRAGAPHIHDVYADHPRDGEPECCNGASAYVYDGSKATIEDSVLEGWVFVEEVTPATITGNVIGWSIVADVGDAALEISRNTTDGIYYTGSGLVEGNHIEIRGGHAPDADYSGIQLRPSTYSPLVDGWTVSDNTIIGAPRGIAVASGLSGTIVGNTLRDNQIAIELRAGDSAVERNVITGGDTGATIIGGSPSLADNVIEGVSGRGIAVGAGASPTLSGNRSCDNGENLWVADTAEPVIDETNELCPDTSP